MSEERRTRMKPRPAELADITALLIRAQSGHAGEVLEELKELLGQAADDHAHDRAQWLRFIRFAALNDRREWAEASQTAQEMIRHAEPYEDRIWSALGHALWGTGLLMQSQFESAYDELARAVVLLEEFGDTASYAVGHTINATAIALVRLDLYELATTWLDKMRHIAQELSDAMLKTLYAYNSGWLHLIWASELELINELDDAREHYRQTLAAFETAPVGTIGSISESAWPSEVIVQTCAARAMLGEGTVLLEDLRKHMETVEPTQRDEATLIGHLAMSRAYSNDGYTDRAMEEAKIAISFGDALPRLEIVSARAYAEYAALLRERDGLSPAAEAYSRLTARLLRDRWDERRARVVAFEERLAHERVRDELRRRAAAYLTDTLTGLSNRRLIEIRLPEMLVESAATATPLVVAFVDIDDFKSVNDEISHLVGDDLLRELSQEMRAVVSADDVIARFGGEEFVFVLPGRTSEEGFAEMDHLRERIERRDWRCLPEDRRITVTIGLAQSWPGASRTQMLAAADEALLRAKRAGKNRVEIRAHPFNAADPQP